MKSPHSAVCILGLFIATTGLGQQNASSAPDLPGASSIAAIQSDTPAQLRIAAAKQQIKSDPKKVQAYNELAIAFLTRARETTDSSYLKDADAALAQGLALDATDFQLQ